MKKQPSGCRIQQQGITITFDGVPVDSTGAVEAANAKIDQVQARNRAYVESLNREQLVQLQRELVKRATPAPEAVARTIALRAIRPTRQVRTAQRPRPRGAGPGMRRSAQRSSAESGDSGDSSDDPPRGRRLNSRREIDEWVAERERVLSALILAEGLGRHQLTLDESEAA